MKKFDRRADAEESGRRRGHPLSRHDASLARLNE
jgi:hypothetical protein